MELFLEKLEFFFIFGPPPPLLENSDFFFNPSLTKLFRLFFDRPTEKGGHRSSAPELKNLNFEILKFSGGLTNTFDGILILVRKII